MGGFIVYLTEQAKADLARHKRSGNKAIEKRLKQILEELKVQPNERIGRPEQLKHELKDFWSRRISRKDRMIYSVNEQTVVVEVISALGHYGDH